MSNASANKRQKEKDRAERKRDKAARRQERREERARRPPGESSLDEAVAAIVPGPQAPLED